MNAYQSQAAARALARLREICLGFPGTSEKEAWGAPTFRARGRMFAMFADNHHGDGRIAVWCSAPPDAQRIAMADDPENLFFPPYVGPKGWIGVRLDRGIDGKMLAAFLEQAYRWASPPKAVARPRARLITRRSAP
jgi:predicted DNA-binding protein (MmcQ/YjbR family)